MTAREIIYRHIYNTATLSYPIFYGYANTSPAYTMKTVSDPEDKNFLCDTDGNSGEIILQFDFGADQQSGLWNQFKTENQLEELKSWVINNVTGQITVAGNTIRLYNVRVSGIRPFGDPQGLFYGALFEVVANWSGV